MTIHDELPVPRDILLAYLREHPDVARIAELEAERNAALARAEKAEEDLAREVDMRKWTSKSSDKAHAELAAVGIGEDANPLAYRCKLAAKEIGSLCARIAELEELVSQLEASADRWGAERDAARSELRRLDSETTERHERAIQQRPAARAAVEAALKGGK